MMRVADVARSLRFFALSALSPILAWGLTTGIARAEPPVRTWGGDVPAPPQSESPLPPIAPPADEVAARAPASDPEVGAASFDRAPTPMFRQTLEGVEIRGNTATLARVILRYVPYKPGDSLSPDDRDLELVRFRLLGTGFFRDVQLSLRKGSRRGAVVLVVTVAERSTVVVNDVWLGVSADAEPNGRAKPLAAYGGLDVAETNLVGTGITLGGALALADRQLALRTRFVDPNFLRSSWIVEAQLLYNNAKDFFGIREVKVDDPAARGRDEDYAVVAYQRFGGLAGVGHDLGSLATQIYFDYRLEKLDAELPLAASHRRGLDREPIDFFIARGSSVLSAARVSLVHDTRDEPVLPSRGVYVGSVLDAGLTPVGGDYGFSKLVVRASRWTPLPWGHILRLEATGGAIFGDAPLFEKFYVGDYTDLLPDRVLDLNVDRRASPNYFGTSILEVRYGDYAAKIQGEYRVPIYRGRRTTYGVDFFGAVGVFAVAGRRDFTEPARGYSGLARIPLDLTFNLGLRIDTSAGGFVLGISNVLGFVPVRQGGP